MNKLTISLSPHISSKLSISGLMLGVVYALIPAFLVSVFFYGISVIIVTVVSVFACIGSEYLIQKYLLKTPLTILDGSALVTGLLLAFNLPANLPLWIIIIGAIVSVGIGKMTFGGLGNNPFNPALVGRVFLLISFPVEMTTYPVPKGFNTSYLDAATGATPLALIKEGVKNGMSVPSIMGSDSFPSYQNLFLGQLGGSLGEIAAFALIIGLFYMLIRKIITWHIPITIILTVFVFTGLMWLINPDQYADPLFHILTGGVMLGAIYMATDYVTSPMNTKAMIIYAIGIGIITCLIRLFGAYPEGISFAILIMNGFVPLLNRYIKPVRFGKLVKVK